MVSKEFHRKKREQYGSLLEENTMEIIWAGEEKQEKGDQNYKFVPEADFYYLTGFDKPKACLLSYNDKGEKNCVLFIEETDERKARWEGVSYTVESVKKETGIEEVAYLHEMEAYRTRLKEEFKLREKETYTDLSLLRQVKTKEEIALHRKACELTTKGVDAILQHLRPKLYEYQIEAYFDFVLKSNQANYAFPTIAASGANACVLHYHDNNCVMKDGDLILFDLGAEWGHYASDVSRTFPVNGVFTQKQRILYEIVLKGLKAALAATKPGQVKSQLQEISKQVMAEELIKIEYMNEIEEINQFYFHGSGHFIGLFTHDVGNNDAVLEKDMVFTLEPGLYFEEEGIGIRIEDTILITEDGCEVLTAGIPKEIKEIEEMMAKYKSHHQ